jgi:16S rRNA (guanine527-N7)-methyltransferase
LNIAKTGAEAIVVNWRTEEWFPELSKIQHEKLKKFHEELLSANKGLPLINVKAIPNADQVLFADCIIGCRLILKETLPEEIFDFGSGNGFPGVILAILNDSIKICLVEADVKKADFLRALVQSLGLKSVTISARQVESLPAESIKAAICRDLSILSKTLLLARRSFATGGSFFHIKGEEWSSEVMALPSQLCTFWQPALLSEYKLPQSEVKRAVVKTNKIKV